MNRIRKKLGGLTRLDIIEDRGETRRNERTGFARGPRIFNTRSSHGTVPRGVVPLPL